MKKGLGAFSIAFMYVGAVMGAAFASGREIWQFFGVFGNPGYIGIAVVAVIFVLLGFVTSRVTLILDTNDIGRVIVPFDNRLIKKFTSYFLILTLYVAFMSLCAAGGALFSQQFGLSHVAGSFAVVCLVIITVIGGFGRVAAVSRIILPVLMMIVVFTSLAIIIRNGGLPDAAGSCEASPLAGSWGIAAALYLSYSSLVIIPIISTASLRAKSKTHATAGSMLGGLFVGVLAFLLLSAILTDMEFSNSMDMPMLAYSGRLSVAANIVYLGVMMFAIYTSATINFYGFSVRCIKEPNRNLKIVVAAFSGFAISLVGFAKIIAYLFPVIGYLGFLVLIMLMLNFFRSFKLH